MALTRRTKPLDEIGDSIVKKVGRAVFTLTWAGIDWYTVTTRIGEQLVGEHCQDYTGPNAEDEARAYAWLLAEFYHLPENYVWPCGCGDLGWIAAGVGVWHPCGGCNQDGGRPRP